MTPKLQKLKEDPEGEREWGSRRRGGVQGGSARALANKREKRSRLELGMKLHYLIHALSSFPEQAC